MFKITKTVGEISIVYEADTVEGVIALSNAEEDWVDWEWTEEKIYPETLDTLVYVRHRDWTSRQSVPQTVRYWGGDMSDQTKSPWHNLNGGLYDIVAYKVVK